ncbi:amino acid ABC transporter permease [Clostridium felsineum]|uniref:amino acid ABC transporter permease n=1 Tax=Clostridium felsineum TaxID=36839 RepID=UPI00098CEF97|nr:amino acid ABC transporter permease [Clostridium felsineum]URZ18400.1 L-cystine transport system permease protein TcyM [Clostridium felsineum DSM 794]
MNFDFSFMLVALRAALKATPTTLLLTIVPFIIGLIFGTLLAVFRIFKIKVLAKISQIYVVIIRGIPIVLLLLIVYFSTNQIIDVFGKRLHLKIRFKDINTIYIAYVALSLYAIAAIEEVVRGAFLSVGKGQFEASYSVGLTRIQTVRRIIIPQALPIALPTLCSTVIGLIKGSSLAYMVAVIDLLNAAIITANANYKFLEVYVAAAIIYWGLTIVIEGISGVLERKLALCSRRGIS